MTRQRKRILGQAGFFVLFVLAPVFDLFRLDLIAGHFVFLGMDWTLGLDDFLAGRIGAGEAALNLVLRGFVPILAVGGTLIWVAWRYGRLYCGWLCPHFSVVETINGLMRRAIGRQSLWDRRSLPERDPDGQVVRPRPAWWPVVLGIAALFAFTWATALLTYLLPPAEVYGNLWYGTLTRNQSLFIGVASAVFFAEFMLARHLFCRFGCAVGLFQSLAWMGNRRALVVRFDRSRVEDCVGCPSACDNACPMRLKPRNIKRLMFACTQCGRCLSACADVQRENPQGALLAWVEGEAARAESEAGIGGKLQRRTSAPCRGADCGAHVRAGG